MHPAVYRLVLGSLGACARILEIRKPIIFCFHSVTGPADNSSARSAMAVDVKYLERLILDLRSQATPIISLEEACRKITKADTDPFVVLTFDDGYRDNYHNLFPLMSRLQVPFTIFVTTGLVDRKIPMWWDAIEPLASSSGRAGDSATPSHNATNAPLTSLATLTEQFRERDPSGQRDLLATLARESNEIDEQFAYERALTWSMLREMSASGLLTVGAHTEHHPMLNRLTRSEVQAELAYSRERLQGEIGLPVDYLAYPYGQPWEVGSLARDVAKELGYKAAFSTVARPVEPGDRTQLFDIPRVLLSSKAQRSSIALAYMSGLPAALNRIIDRGPRS